ncbi:Na+/H+ antiporter subunit E [Flagellatimonas centrodinii]|uniref:Na+/H+ antiporter subunit E n=1 Tax=Flagellatimonas centrodinii TaxID=2806210 RepID=UPI001FF02DFD|nr:Na+/H+ antiporter subunit E [Flagellatimonas centrodinii]ULQ45140.1 Na+/H+ antiporter subunit E [Flagellatimonas centrodinii]
MRHACSLFVALALLWLLLSGHYAPLWLGFGLLSCLAVVALAVRMKVVDAESVPLQLGLRLPVFWLWLGWEMVKANAAVLRCIVMPGAAISPTWARSSMHEVTDGGRAILANAITLTPGTLSVRMHADHIEVHALTREGARAIEAGVMDDRVTALERGAER